MIQGRAGGGLPDPLEHRLIRVSGGELAYVDMGEGPPVLLLHGFPTSSFLWRREAWLLAQRMRVLAPDLLGYGRSEKPETADLSERAQAGYVRELLDRLDVREVAAVGHGVGGTIAQLLALGPAPPVVQVLVLVDAPSPASRPSDPVLDLRTVPPEEWSAEAAEQAVRVTFDRGMGHRERLDEPTLQGYLEPWRGQPHALLRAARGLRGEALDGREEELARLDQPAFLIWGEDDPLVPPEVGERLGDLLDGSTLALLPGCSHFVGEDAPQTVGPLIYEYLRSRYLGERHHHGSAPVPVFLERPPDPGLWEEVPEED